MQHFRLSFLFLIIIKPPSNATVGDTTVLPCPIKPGALLQHYSARWEKDSILISESINLQTTTIDPRYKINETTFSLIINSVNVNDSSMSYQCKVSVTNPLTGTILELQLSHDTNVLLSLYVILPTTDHAPESSMPANSKLLKCNV